MNAAPEHFSNEFDEFKLRVPDSELERLRFWLEQARYPDELASIGRGYGVTAAELQELVCYWRDGFDFRSAEARLNELPQLSTAIDGLQLHFIHARSPEPGAIPLLLLHGAAGSVVEFQELIEPLTEPRAHAGTAGDAFHVVCPSLPGFGFSESSAADEFDVSAAARACATLMQRLGYQRYAAHGSDLGALVARELGVLDAAHVVAVHLTTLLAFPSEDPDELASLTSADKSRLALLSELAHAPYPDLPLDFALAAGDLPTRARDQLLTQLLLCWLTGSDPETAPALRDACRAPVQKSLTPTGICTFPLGLPVLRRFAERNNNIVYFVEQAHGGACPALEQPELLLQDLRRFFGRFR
jgi:pimeloyl-ACP methyl ester carboxylesterase